MIGEYKVLTIRVPAKCDDLCRPDTDSFFSFNNKGEFGPPSNSQWLSSDGSSTPAISTIFIYLYLHTRM